MIIGLTNGCYDALHEGHRLFLAAASAHCDYLIVAVNDDASVRRLKGEGRPIYPLEQRIYDIQTKCAADVHAIIPFGGAVVPLIASLSPNVVVRGHDQTAEGSHLARLIRIGKYGQHSTTRNLDNARGSLPRP